MSKMLSAIIAKSLLDQQDQNAGSKLPNLTVLHLREDTNNLMTQRIPHMKDLYVQILLVKLAQTSTTQ